MIRLPHGKARSKSSGTRSGNDDRDISCRVKRGPISGFIISPTSHKIVTSNHDYSTLGWRRDAPYKITYLCISLITLHAGYAYLFIFQE